MSADLNLALIGNATIAALVDTQASLRWCCLPTIDGAPVFDALLRDEEDRGRGAFSIDMAALTNTTQSYRKNTAVLITEMTAEDGSQIRITDFIPRFKQFGRTYRPVMIVRMIEPISGTPRVTVRLKPSVDFGNSDLRRSHGSNHVRYIMSDQVMRLTTNASITAVLEERPFVVDRPTALVFGPDETCRESVWQMAARFRDETCEYWYEWVRYLSIPFEWQSEVIRAAITLKLNAFDDTGAIIAAVTTSIPESPNSGRNWDYRYCWLRDAYFVVSALNRLGATQTMERYLRYIINLITDSDDGFLQPVYRISGSPDIDEREIESLTGYRGMGPVRIGNAAYTQVQHDVFGAAILAAAHVFFDQRLRNPGDETLFHQLEILGQHAAGSFDKPDAGIWEFRGIAKVHTFSSVMCWAACDRLARIANQLGLDERNSYWRRIADEMHTTICAQAWNEDLGCFVESFGGQDLDASLLLLAQLGFVDAKDPRFAQTVDAITDNLRIGDMLLRYATEDDFGRMETAFTVCTFWYIEALADLGRDEQARALFETMLARCNEHGLLSEDIDLDTGELWGNFPQTYSMVGLINSALRLSRPWEGEF